MRKILFLLLTIVVLGCNDGDIIVTSFDFDSESLESCGSDIVYVFFKINNDAQESISLQITSQDPLFQESGTEVFNLDGTSNFANYRIYDANLTADYFCSSIPPTSPAVTIDYLGTSGVANIITVTTLDDNDNLEEVEDDSIDSDEDGIPNYYDFDDDGDNVPTAAELGDDPLNPMDTDLDGIDDYLDEDDDGDGILTRNEDLDGDLNPANDQTDPTVGPNYLNNAVAIENIVDEYRQHTYSRSSDMRLIVNDLVLINSEEQIIQEEIDFGEKSNVLSDNPTVTPAF